MHLGLRGRVCIASWLPHPGKVALRHWLPALGSVQERLLLVSRKHRLWVRLLTPAKNRPHACRRHTCQCRAATIDTAAPGQVEDYN